MSFKTNLNKKSSYFNHLRNNRSAKYQHLLVEAPWKEVYNNIFSNADGISGKLSQFQYSEQIIDLQDRLFKRVIILAKKHCTDRQLMVLNLSLDGYNQSEIGNMLGIEQSTITKTINGVGLYGKNKDFRTKGKVNACLRSNRQHAKKYGGFIKKLKAAADQDDEIQSILKDISDLRNEIL